LLAFALKLIMPVLVDYCYMSHFWYIMNITELLKSLTKMHRFSIQWSYIEISQSNLFNTERYDDHQIRLGPC